MSVPGILCGRLWLVRLILGALSMSALAAPGEQPGPTDKFKNLEFREIGPATMGGRIDDFAVVESNPNIVYVGTASGACGKQRTMARRGSRYSIKRACRRLATSLLRV